MVVVKVEALVTFNKKPRIWTKAWYRLGAETLQEVLYLENLDAKVVQNSPRKYMSCTEYKHVIDVIKKDIGVQCAKHPGRLHSYDHPTHTQPKIVQEVTGPR